jgi:hypothetical protein
MIGRQIISNLFEFLPARCQAKRFPCSKHEDNSNLDQTKSNHNLYQFQTRILFGEYLEIGITVVSFLFASKSNMNSISYISHSIRFRDFICCCFSVRHSIVYLFIYFFCLSKL